MIAMAHRLHAIGADFALHYSCASRKTAGFLSDLDQVAWASKVHLHISDEATRCDLSKTLIHRTGAHVYTCGPEAYMDAVIDTATANGFPEESRHLEYFSTPEQPDYENHDFTLRLAKSGKDVLVPADQSPTDALLEAGIAIDVKCSDGLCGVCKCALISGTPEHRDFVLSNKDRESAIILCQSRAAEPGGILEIDL
jgi:ferredoxin